MSKSLSGLPADAQAIIADGAAAPTSTSTQEHGHSTTLGPLGQAFLRETLERFQRIAAGADGLEQAPMSGQSAPDDPAQVVAPWAAPLVAGQGPMHPGLAGGTPRQRIGTAQEREPTGGMQFRTEAAIDGFQAEHRIVQHLEAATHALVDLRGAAEREREALHSEREALQLRVGNQLAELHDLRSQLAATKADLSASGKHIQGLDRELVELRSAHQALEDLKHTLQAEQHEQACQRAVERGGWQVERSRHTQQLAELNRHLRQAHDQVETLQTRLSSTAEALDQARSRQQQTDEQRLDALGQLQGARQLCGDLEGQLSAARAELQRQQDRLLAQSSELETERALGRDHRLQKEKLQVQLQHARRHAEELRGELERARQLRQAAEEQATRTRSTFSFRLGYTLLHGFKSYSAVRELPGQLWALHQESRHQRSAATRTLPATSPAPALSPEKPDTSDIRPTLRGNARLLPLELPASEALRSLKVAAIMDEFTRASFAPECNLLSLSVDRWQEELQAFEPDMLFIESAWRGKDDRWGSKVGHLGTEVQGVLSWCREHKVPTAFWNKEDPIHFETFLNTARLFDHVFTTDIDCIPRYKAGLGHDRVHLLPFACQPRLSNPVEQYERKNAFCFAGAYYLRYPERTRDLGNFMLHLAEYRPVEIYDRNFGKNDPNYQFPPEYRPFIVGTLPFQEIDKAYKGYRYAINLNSIKQSQSMFARRVFELLASNTLTISNFSRGLRTLFGDLVVTSDNGSEIVRRLQALETDPRRADLFRLAGLRKVMMEHTYQDRLACVVGHLQGRAPGPLLPRILVTAYAKNQLQWDAIWANYSRQDYPHKELLVLTPKDFQPQRPDTANGDAVRVLRAADVADSLLADWVNPHGWLAGMTPDDHYGRHYLTDLALATRYADTPLVGKGSHSVWSPRHGHQQHQGAAPYTRTQSLAARAALVQPNLVADIRLKDWTASLYNRVISHDGALSVDPFNYCKNGAPAADHLDRMDDLHLGDKPLDQGLPLPQVVSIAEALPAQAASVDTAPRLSGAEFSQWFKPPAGKPWQCAVEGEHWLFQSNLADASHEYLYCNRDVTPTELGMTEHLNFHLDISTGLNLQLVALFLDAKRQRISHAVKMANRNQEVPIPTGTAFIRLGLRIYGSGSARVNALVLGHRPLQPGVTLPCAEHLVLTNHYPSYDDLYRNAFVHSRVQSYREQGVAVDVFRLRAEETTSYHEHQNIDVVTGSGEALHRLLATGQYKTVLVHFLELAMWEVLQKHIDRVRVVVWVHGADIQPYERRAFSYDTAQEHLVSRTRSDQRMAFWRQLLRATPANLKLVFVSRYLAETAMEDLGFRLPDDVYTIIPNPINTDLFTHQPKPAEQRLKILSIRPYASRIYANDLSVAAILELSNEPFFQDLEFRLIGDGKLFDSVVEPLRPFSNVVIERRFLTQQEIARLHKDYGAFLCPSRMDTQGVSRDEAMASGLVPITNAVAAIPEFVSDQEGLLAPGEDSSALAQGIRRLAQDPQLFKRLSENAALRVRQQSGKRQVIEQELSLFVIATPKATLANDKPME